MKLNTNKRWRILIHSKRTIWSNFTRKITSDYLNQNQLFFCQSCNWSSVGDVAKLDVFLINLKRFCVWFDNSFREVPGFQGSLGLGSVAPALYTDSWDCWLWSSGGFIAIQIKRNCSLSELAWSVLPGGVEVGRGGGRTQWECIKRELWGKLWAHQE